MVFSANLLEPWDEEIKRSRRIDRSDGGWCGDTHGHYS